MLSFKEYNQSVLTEASIRQGLPHIKDLTHQQALDLVGKEGTIRLEGMTQKTDGMNMKFGHDEQGFYTQSTGSGNEKMRSPEDYEKRARANAEKSGKEYNSRSSEAFGHIHRILQNNGPLQNHLRIEHGKTGKDVAVHGEIFYRPFGKPSEYPGEVRFVGTSYATSHMGNVGKFVIHSKLPINQEHDTEHFKKNLSNSDINFDDDKMEHPVRNVDVKDEAKELKNLNGELLASRTKPSNKEAKQQEQAKLTNILGRMSNKTDSTISSMNLPNKWGSESEGVVIHGHSKAKPNAPTVKSTSATFRNYRESDAANWKK